MKKHSGNTGRILEYLKKNKSITSMEAFEKFGATRLSAMKVMLFRMLKEVQQTDLGIR